MLRNGSNRPAALLAGVLAGVVWAVTALAPATRADEPVDVLVKKGPAPDALFLYTGDVIGYVDSCGCKKNPAGSVSRRAWVIDKVEALFPKTPRLIADSGNFTDNPTDVGKARTVALLDAMKRIGYQVVNVGERDVKSGYAEFLERTGKSGLPFVSANIVRKADKSPIFEPHRVVEAKSADGSASFRVGVIGIARFNPIFVKDGPDGSEMIIEHPLEPVKAQVAALQKKNVDLIVLLAAVHRDDASRLVRDVPEIDFVIGSYGGYFGTYQDSSELAWISYSGNQGKRLGETRLYYKDGKISSQETRLHFMTDVYPADPEMLELQEAAPGRDENLPKVSSAATAGPYLGAGACRDCHAVEVRDWAGSGHARAMTTLEKKGRQDDADCVKCHATAVGLAGGFVDRTATPLLANVGCESCHGAARDHVNNPRSPYGKVTVGSCTGCHDRANSPNFDFYSYSTRVNHVQEATH